MKSESIAKLIVEHPSRYAGQSLSRQPVELTSFSFDKQRALHLDDRSLSYYWPADRGSCLSDGFEKVVSRDESINEHIDAILIALIAYENEHGTQKTAVDVITWRGLITKLMVLPYSTKDTFELNATRMGDTVYIEECKQDVPKEEEDLRQRTMAYWGVKYEALATIPHTWDETPRFLFHRNDNVVNTNEQYCSIVRTRLGSVSLLLAGEVDCCYDYKPSNAELGTPMAEDNYGNMKPPSAPIPSESVVSHYVELKTSKIITADYQRINFEKFKMLKFWAQSYLLGIPRIIVGFRDDNGILIEEEVFETLKIPGLVRAGSGAWDGNASINFATQALEFIKQAVTGKGVYRIRYGGQQVLEVYEIEREGHGQILSDVYIQHKAGQASNHVN